MKRSYDNASPRQDDLVKYIKTLKGGVGIAFSGGVDSAYLVKAALLAGLNILPLFMLSPFVPKKECKWMDTICRLLNIIPLKAYWNPFNEVRIIENSPMRCYYCKFSMYSKIKKICYERGIKHLADGTQWDDLKSIDRPGLAAVRELGVKTPLADMGFGKMEIRLQSRALAMPTWDRPPQSCLATRVSHGRPITPQLLGLIEASESLLEGMGASQVRVKIEEDKVRIRCAEKDANTIKRHWKEIEKWMGSTGFDGAIPGDIVLEAIF
ncbi:MAG: ATP-dependent sacrificial sulfur transferase LarE [Desulfobacteraceae bacterium]|nr:ATP-dependent sacrificial sulfur transferase LarE [Desulfobacteraceae bacterium]